MSKIIKEIKKRKRGILIGGLFGAVLTFIMKSTSPHLMAVESGGLIEKIITTPGLDMGFIKILIILVVVGAYIGYIIEDRLKK